MRSTSQLPANEIGDRIKRQTTFEVGNARMLHVNAIASRNTKPSNAGLNLWIFEFDRNGMRTAGHQIHLENHCHSLTVHMAETTERILPALRLSGQGTLEFEKLQIMLFHNEEIPNLDRTKLSCENAVANQVLMSASDEKHAAAEEKRQAIQELFEYDKYLFLQTGETVGNGSERIELESRLMVAYHRVEKALAFRDVRPGFGKQVAGELASDLQTYIDDYGFDEIAIRSLRVLKHYVDYNEGQGIPNDALSEIVDSCTAQTPSKFRNFTHDPVIVKYRKEIIKATNIDFARFVGSRHSIRDFVCEPVDIRKIKAAVELANRTPSSCNRQPWCVHVYREKEKEHMLRLNSGHGGFTHSIDTLLVVTGDPLYYPTGRERNQVFIDLGMFSMSLVLSLHHQQLGVCTMATCVSGEEEDHIKHVGNIDPAHRLIMMLAVGNIPEKLKVPTSARRDISSIFRIHDFSRDDT
jgi:nitroreductase